MRRARVFAAPFVVTAALTGCEDHSRTKPKPEPRTERPDAQISINPPTPQPDAMMSHNPPMPLPDAAPLAEAPKGATTFRDASGCHVFGKPYELVRCPDDGATLTVPQTQSVGDVSLQTYNLQCEKYVHVDCPPPDQATCNPPPPQPVACPPELLPMLRPGLDSVRNGDHCTWHVDATNDVEVACAAAVVPPDPLSITRGSATIMFSTSTMTCFQEEPFDCPDPGPGKAASCNPPAPTPIDCPDELLPTVSDGIKIKKHDGTCWYEQTQVRCP